jgi:hypothetical protein
MTRVRVESFTVSLDGYGAGPDQSLENPLGIGGTGLHPWLWPTRTFQRHLFGRQGRAHRRRACHGAPVPSRRLDAHLVAPVRGRRAAGRHLRALGYANRCRTRRARAPPIRCHRAVAR